MPRQHDISIKYDVDNNTNINNVTKTKKIKNEIINNKEKKALPNDNFFNNNVNLFMNYTNILLFLLIIFHLYYLLIIILIYKIILIIVIH